MTDTTNPQQAERRNRYAAAIRDEVRLRLGSNALALAERGQPVQMNFSEAATAADAVMAVADAEQAELRTRIAELESSCRDVDRLRKDWVEMRDRVEELDDRAKALAAVTVPAPAPTDQAALRSDLEDALKGAGVYDSKERMWHSLSPEWIEEILTEVLAVLPAPAACSDPIECSHEAALGQAEAAVARVRSVLESEAVVGRSALDYRGLITTALMADAASGPGGVAGETQQPCDGCGHPEHPARQCPVTLYGERCACDEPLAGEAQQPETQPLVVHAIPEPGSNGISDCCNRPPCEFVGERVTRNPNEVTCPGPAAVSQPDEEA